MQWSWDVGRIAGIRLRMHVTFPVLFVWVVVSSLRGGATPSAVAATVGLLLAVFAVVVLHEGAHAVTARRFGIRTKDITLLPIGGIARLERMPREPRQELLIALAALMYAILAASGHIDALRPVAREDTNSTLWTALANLFRVNVSLAAFNLLPAFPMDGGRVLRALLTMRTRDYAKATQSAARLGRAFALLFGLVATFVIGNPVLVVIAVFVWVAAGSEALLVQTSAVLEHVQLARLMITDVRTLAPNDPLALAAHLTIDGFQQDFPVLDAGALVGMLTRRDLVRALAEGGGGRAVGSAMQRDYPTASIEDPIESVLHRLTALGASALPVVRGRELLGLLTMENVSEFLMLRAADPTAVPSS